MKIFFRQPDLFGKRTVPLKNPEDGPVRAMSRKSGSTHLATMTGAVDLTGDSLPGIFPGFSDADKFVPEDSLKPHVSANQLQVGLTDSGAQHSNGDLPRSILNDEIVLKSQPAGLQDNSLHEMGPPVEKT